MRRAALALSLLAATLLVPPQPVQAGTSIRLQAADSLEAAMTEIAEAFEQAHGIAVVGTFGPSGLLRERIENGEPAEVYASANLRHPNALARAGLAGPVAMFARNRLCAIAQPGVEVKADSLLDVMLDPNLRLGTSTPKADPAGDYAWEVFAKAEAVQPGARASLESKALKLTGGPDSPPAPEGRNPYG